MTKARRNLHVDVVVSDNLRGADIPRLAAELAKAISEAGVGSIPLSLAGYAAIIAVLSEGDAPLTDTQVKEIQGRFGQHRHTWGHVEQSRQGHALRPRIVSISAEQRDSMVIATARTAAAKHAQLTANRPGIVCVKFGLPVSLEQATNPSLQSAIAAIVRQTLAQEGAHRVSAVLWVMETTVVFPNHGRGLVDPDPDAGDPQQGVILIRNPQASSPLSSDFGI